jgi:hydroxymethylbilane synthase
VKPLRIGTRGSALALWQANFIREELKRLHGLDAELVRIKTSGDNFQNKSIAQIGEQTGTKGVFIKEIEDALLAGTIDLAVHSMKDVPTETPAGLIFAAITEREDPRDCLISRNGETLASLSRGARLGTSSLRRQAQLKLYREDLQVADLRGNVDTRLRKLEMGEFDAIVLAVAGVKRLGAAAKISEVLSGDLMLPAVGQGALGIETRASDADITQLVTALDHASTRACVLAERAVLRTLEGGCQLPLGAWAREQDGALHLEAGVFSADGSEFARRDIRGRVETAENLGERLGHILLDAGADRILRLAGRTVG